MEGKVIIKGHWTPLTSAPCPCSGENRFTLSTCDKWESLKSLWKMFSCLDRVSNKDSLPGTFHSQRFPQSSLNFSTSVSLQLSKSINIPNRNVQDLYVCELGFQPKCNFILTSCRNFKRSFKTTVSFNSINICCNYCNEQNTVMRGTKEPWLTLTHTHTRQVGVPGYSYDIRFRRAWQLSYTGSVRFYSLFHDPQMLVHHNYK